MKQNRQNQDLDKKIQQSEAWAQELEEKLTFTVDKFEEQNKRFLECGKELAEAQEKLEKQELQIQESIESNRILQAQLNALKESNMGPGTNENLGMIPEENAADQGINSNKGKSKEQITIDFLKQ